MSTAAKQVEVEALQQLEDHQVEVENQPEQLEGQVAGLDDHPVQQEGQVAGLEGQAAGLEEYELQKDQTAGQL